MSEKFNLQVILFFSVFLSLVLLPLHNTAAQVTEDESGIYAGIGLLASSMHLDETDKPFIEDDGGGLQFEFGYRFNPAFALGMSLGLADHETTEPGIDALMAMLQTCSLGVAVVNIDAGVQAGAVAALIANRAAKFRKSG